MEIKTRKEKVLVAGIAASLFGVLLMIISIATDYWVELVTPGGYYRNSTDAFVLKHHSGLWRICRTEMDTDEEPYVVRDYCTRIKLFPTSEDLKKDPEVDRHILDYSRSETAFAVLSLGLMFLGIIFSIYAVKEPRYMFKRLAGCIHVMTAICILVCAEVLMRSINYESEYLPARHPEGSYYKYGFSFGLVWVVFVIYVGCAIVNFFYSRKRKGDRAATEKEAIENEPVHLGRF